MALQFKIGTPVVSDTAKTVYVPDATGVHNAVTNPGGYGAPNEEIGDIDYYVIQLSHLSLKEVYTQTQGRVADVPKVFNTPGINEIASGQESIPVNTYRTQIDPNTALKTFGDGVYNIDVSVIFDEAIAATGAKGDTYLVVDSTSWDSSPYDVIYAGGKVYDIDKSKDNNGGTVVYVVQELQDNVNNLVYGYKANAKVPITNDLDTCIKRRAIKGCGCGKSKVLDVWVDYLNSEMAFEDEDYQAANALILGAGNTCKGGCGC